MFLLAAVGAVGVVCLVVIGLVAVFGGDDSNAQNEARLEATTSSLALYGSPTTDDTAAPPTDAPATSATTEATTPTPTEPATTVGATTEPTTSDAAPATTVAPPATDAPPVTEAPAETTPVDPDVPESKAVVRNGQIFLEGAVPTAEAGAAIEALAAEILGPDNVFNNYIVDERAGDPNLGNITVEDTINFATGSADILPEGELLLNQGLALLTIRPAMTITIVGHTDSRGTDEYNLDLSQRRAESVKAWFTDRGVDGDRLTAVGAGEGEPIADNDTVDGRRLNRRIQFFLENILGD